MELPAPSLSAILFGLLFTLAGPVKAMPSFDALTKGMEPPARRRVALGGAAIAAGALALAVLMGASKVEGPGISNEAIGAATGLVLLLVGLLPLIGIAPGGRGAGALSTPSALGIAFPMLVPPHVSGLVILFSLYAQTWQDEISLLLATTILMALNAVAMILAPAVLRLIGMAPFRFMGGVFAIIQVALGIEILIWAIGGAAAKVG